MPKYRRGTGSVYLKRGWCYIKYYVKGEPITEAAGTQNKAEARRLLQARLGQLAEGRFTGPAVERVTITELAQDLLTDYEVNGRRSLTDLKIRLTKHVLPFFAGRKAHAIKTPDLHDYIQGRLNEGASNATVNRELAALRRMYNLGLHAEKIARKPYIPQLMEDNARQGFFERWEFDAVLARLPEYLRPPMTMAYYTGWRTKSEIFPLTWDRVDLDAGTVRLYRGTTKNKEGRVIHLPQVLLAILEAQWQEHLSQYPDCSWVFHRSGGQIKDGRWVWQRACREAGVQKIPHDFRRTAARNLVRAGIPERVAMMITGHKTRSVFDRYNIVSANDLQDAARRIDAGAQHDRIPLDSTADESLPA